jgi:mono/diheme cytochrome c family protein
MYRSFHAGAWTQAHRLFTGWIRSGRATAASGLGGLLVVSVLLAAQIVPADSAEPGLPDAVHGEQVYLQYCAACHNELGKAGPPMVDSVAYFIRAGVPAQAMGPLFYHPVRQRPAGSAMPAFTPEELSDADLNDLGFYLGSQTPAPAMPPALGIAENGAGLYAANCALCHGDETGAGAVTLPLAMFAQELRQGGAPPFVMLGFVNLACRSGYVRDMPTYPAEQLSDEQLADIAAYIYEMPAPAMAE